MDKYFKNDGKQLREHFGDKYCRRISPDYDIWFICGPGCFIFSLPSDFDSKKREFLKEICSSYHQLHYVLFDGFYRVDPHFDSSWIQSSQPDTWIIPLDSPFEKIHKDAFGDYGYLLYNSEKVLADPDLLFMLLSHGGMGGDKISNLVLKFPKCDIPFFLITSEDDVFWLVGRIKIT